MRKYLGIISIVTIILTLLVLREGEGEIDPYIEKYILFLGIGLSVLLAFFSNGLWRKTLLMLYGLGLFLFIVMAIVLAVAHM